MIGNSIIKLNNVDIFQQKHLVLSNVNLHIDKGDFVWLIGQTGSGKSSLLKVIYGDLNIASGSAHACGYELDKIADRDIPFLRRKLGIVFQDFQLLTDRSVEQNLQFVMRATGWTDKKLIADRTLDVLEKVGLRSKLKKMPHDPEIILADEPTGNLDPDTSEEIVLLLKQIGQQLGTAVLIATHDYHIIRTFPSRIIKCENGKVLEDVQIA